MPLSKIIESLQHYEKVRGDVTIEWIKYDDEMTWCFVYEVDWIWKISFTSLPF